MLRCNGVTQRAGHVANVPQGWWHYELATVDQTHLLAIFDASVPEAIFGSDISRLTPASVLAHTYCLDENKALEWGKTQYIVTSESVATIQKRSIHRNASFSVHFFQIMKCNFVPNQVLSITDDKR